MNQQPGSNGPSPQQGDEEEFNEQQQSDDDNDDNDGQQEGDSPNSFTGNGQEGNDDDENVSTAQSYQQPYGSYSAGGEEAQSFQQPYGSYAAGDEPRYDAGQEGQEGYDAGQEGQEGHDAGQEGYEGQEGQEGYDAGQEGFDAGQEGYDAGQEGYEAGQEGYDPGQEGYDAGQGGYGAGQEEPGQGGYDFGQDGYDADQPYDQYGQAQPYGQADPYGQQEPDPYGQSRDINNGGAQPEQPRAAAGTQQKSDDEVLKKNISVALCCVSFLMVVFVALAVVLLVLFLNDDNDSSTPKAAPATAPTPTAPSPTTPAPTPSPGTPTFAPTEFTTPVPTTDPNSPGWQSTSANTFSASRSSAGFGGSLAFAGNTLVAGLPDKAGKPGFGTIVTYSRGSGVRAFSPGGDTVESAAELFGAALAMSYNTATGEIDLAVGAPRTDGILANIVSFGTVYVYRMDANETWSRVGNVIRSTETLQEAGGEFGGSVALAADVDRVAVGAPSRSIDIDNLNTGGVTVYDLVDNTWTIMPSTPLFGPRESYYGQAIDLSNDGTGLLIGAPGRGNYSGQVDFFKWDGSSTWEIAYTVSGQEGTDALGTTVSIINPEGTQIAYGAPYSNGNLGAVSVFEDDGSGTFTQMGEDIVGEEADEMVGMVLCAKKSRVAIGTQTGFLRVYDYNVTEGAWLPVLNSPNVGEAITTCAMSDNANAVVVGLASEEVKVFDLILPS